MTDAPSPVLLVDGEELIGAKQNRVLNLSILIPAKQRCVIPICCVEAGRWRAASREFSIALARKQHVVFDWPARRGDAATWMASGRWRNAERVPGS